MVVGIDYTAAAWQGAGIGRYTRELVHAAAAAAPATRFVLFYAASGLPANGVYHIALRELCATQRNVRAVAIPLTPWQLTMLWQRARVPLPVEWFTGRLDLVHAPDFALPPTRARTLLTVHDLTFLLHPQWFVPGLRRYLAKTVPRSLRRADLVLADSAATRADLIRLLGSPAERVVVVYPGVGAEFRRLPAAQLVTMRERLGLPDAFLLFVGTIEPRKNLPRLLGALARLHASGACRLPLVIAGRKGWLYDEVFAAVARHGLQTQVHWLDFVADADLPALYNLATAFVYPSLYEGFGLPVAEALACGTPVVTSRRASLPEIAGNAAVLVDPADETAIAAGIVAACNSGGRLRTIGPRRAAQFSWERAARELLACYERAL